MAEKTPEVSVVIPCFNGERFLSDAIESVLRQTHGPVEIVVVDDGSTDGSVVVAERYAADGRVTYVRHESNKGIAAARNTGLRRSRGRFVGFLDQDDLWQEDKVDCQLAALAKDPSGETGVVFSEIDTVPMTPDVVRRERYRKLGELDGLDTKELLTQFFMGNSIPIISTLIRRECFDSVGVFDEEIRSGADDFDLFVRIAQRYRFAYVAKKLAVRRLHESNFTDTEKMVPDTLRTIARTVAESPSLELVAARARSYHLFCLARDLHVKGEYARAKAAYRDSISARPSNLKARAGLVLCGWGRIGDALYEMFRRFRDRA
jgi:glycosyltransferase involved in cell wall biosynthesis